MDQHIKTIYFLGLCGVFLLIQNGNAVELKVGGVDGWTVPSDPNAMTYNQWAESHRFKLGDSLLFVYASDKDSVLHVSKDDYTNCMTSTSREKFSDGHTIFKLNQSGPHYFISGIKENCLKQEKMVLVVLGDRSNSKRSPPPPPPPPPPPSEATDMTPSPAPSGESAPSQPSSDQSPPPPPRSGSSTILVGINIIGSLGAFLSSFLLLVF